MTDVKRATDLLPPGDWVLDQSGNPSTENHVTVEFKGMRFRYIRKDAVVESD